MRREGELESGRMNLKNRLRVVEPSADRAEAVPRAAQPTHKKIELVRQLLV